MDFYLNTNHSSSRLVEEYKQYGSLVIVYDFDDTVFDFHNKGRVYHHVIELIRKLKAANCYLICWTGQEDLTFVKAYLRDNNIPFDGVNENPPFHKSTSKKVYANAYLDDRAGLQQVYQELNLLLNTLQQ